MAVLECGHPASCLENIDGNPRRTCKWCADLAVMEQTFEEARELNKKLQLRLDEAWTNASALRAQLDKKALHLEPGEHSFGKGPCTIGYLTMGPHSTLNLGDPNSDGWMGCRVPGENE